MLFAIFCFLDDLHKLEDYVLSIWESYSAGKMDLATASITTNTSFELATQLTTELELEYPNLKNWRDLITNLYSSQENVSSLDIAKSSEWVYLDAAVALHAALVLQHAKFFTPTGSGAKLRLKYMEPCRYMPEALIERTPRGPRPAWNRSLVENKGNIRGVIGHYLKNLMKTVKISKALPIEDHFMGRLTQLHDRWPETEDLDIDLVFMSNVVHGIRLMAVKSSQRPTAQLLTAVEQAVLCLSNQMMARSRSACGCPSCATRASDMFVSVIRIVDTQSALAGLPILYDDLAGNHGPEVYYPVVPSDPVLCGLLMLRYDVLLSQIGLELCNLTESTMGIAHLYNACMVTGDLTQGEQWPDLERMITLCREDRVFLGSRPTDPVTFRNR